MPTEEEYKAKKETPKEVKPAKPINIKVKSMNNALGALLRR